jgi:tetratricopeptide (TPR) repeat protein
VERLFKGEAYRPYRLGIKTTSRWFRNLTQTEGNLKMLNTSFVKKIGQLFSVLIFLLVSMSWQGNGFFVAADDNSDKIETLIKRAKEYSNKNEHPKSLEMYQKAVALLTDDNKNSLDAAKLYFDLGFVNYNHLKQYNEALEWFQKALVIREKELGEENVTTSWTYRCIAQCYDYKKNPTNALEFFLKQLKYELKEHGENNSSTAFVYYNIGEQLLNLEKHQEALHFFLKTYQIRSIDLNKNNEYMKLVLSKLKESYEKCNKDEQFEKWLRKNLQQNKTDSKEIITTQPQTKKLQNKRSKEKIKNELRIHANTLLQNKKAAYNFAEKYSGEEKSKTIKEKGNKLDLALADSRSRVGKLYEELGDFETAFYYQFAAYLTYEEVLGVNNNTTKELLKTIKQNLNQSTENEMYKDIIKQAENSTSKLVVEQMEDAYLFFGESLEDMENRQLKKELGKKRSNIMRNLFNP